MFIVTHNAGNRANRCKSDELQVFGLRWFARFRPKKTHYALVAPFGN